MSEQEAGDDSERWVWSWTGFTQTPAWGGLYRNWAVPMSTTVSDMFIQIFFCLRKLEKIINLEENVLTFFYWTTILQIQIQEFCLSPLHAQRSLLEWLNFYFWDPEFCCVWLEVMVSRLLSCMWQARFKHILKMLQKITYGASGDSDQWGRRRAGGKKFYLSLHTCFKAYYFRLLTKYIVKA